MTSQDQYHDVSGVNALNSQTIGSNGTVNGNSIDLIGYKACTIFIQTGTVTDGTHVPSLEDSDDGSTWGAVAAANVLGPPSDIVAADDNKVKRIGYAGKKRYCRLVITSSGVTTGVVIAAIAVKGAPEHMPVADD